MSYLFDTVAHPTDKYFLLVKDDPECLKCRQFVEHLWHLYEPYADKHFKEELACQFHPRFWEMYLACALMEQGLTLVPTDKGPDICLEVGNRRIWIEATAPGPGKGPDALEDPEIPADGTAEAFGIPEREIILRYLSAIENKHRKYFEYREQELVLDAEPFVVGVNGGSVPFSSLEPGMPYILKALFPFGDYAVTVDRQSSQVVTQGYAYRPEIAKKQGATVSTRVFLDKRYSTISAVVFSNANVFCHPAILGEGLVVIHNPNASSPLELGWLKVGTEYWLGGEALKSKRWSKSA